MPHMYVAYEEAEPGLPVAAAETLNSMAETLGITVAALCRLTGGENGVSKRNRFGVPLVVRKVEIDNEKGGE